MWKMVSAPAALLACALFALSATAQDAPKLEKGTAFTFAAMGWTELGQDLHGVSAGKHVFGPASADQSTAIGIAWEAAKAVGQVVGQNLCRNGSSPPDELLGVEFADPVRIEEFNHWVLWATVTVRAKCK